MIVKGPSSQVWNEYGTLSGNTVGTSTYSGTNVVFVGGSNITLQGLSDSVYIHGASGGGGTGSGVAISAGTTQQANGVVIFSNASGVSWGLNAGTLTASVKTDYQSSGAYLTTAQPPGAYLTTAQPPGAYLTTQTVQPMYYSASGTSSNSGTLQFSNTNGISFSLTNGAICATVATNYQSQGAYLTTAAGVSHTHGSAPSITGGLGVTSNSSAWSISVGAYLTTAMGTDGGSAFMSTGERANYFYTSNNTFANSTHSHGNPTLALTNIAGSTASASSGLTLSLSYPASSNFFATSGFTFANSTHTHGSAPSITGPVSVTSNSGAWSINVGAIGTGTSQTNVTWTVGTAGFALNAAGYAGTATGATNCSVTAASGGISVNVPTPALQYFEIDDIQGFALMTHISAIDRRPIFVPFNLPGRLTNNSCVIQVSGVTNNSVSLTVQVGIYTYANGTSINLLDSLQNAFSVSDTGSASGNRYMVLSGFGTNATALTAGPYVLALNFSANGGNTASGNFSLYGGATGSGPVGFMRPGSNQNNTTATASGAVNFWGRYTANSAALPAAVGTANIFANFSGASQPLAAWFILRS